MNKVMHMQATNLSPGLSNQKGLSLIELMVSLIIGAFLLGGLATNLITTKKLDKSRQAVSEMDSNAQLTLDVIRQAVSHGGYPSIRKIDMEKAFFSEEDGEPNNPDCRGVGIKRDLDGFTPTKVQWTTDAQLSDVLTVVSMTDNPCIDGEDSCAADALANSKALVYTDCADGGVERDERTVACSTDLNAGMNNPIEARIYNTFRLNTLERTLMCQGSRGGSVTLADGVYAMQFLYGVRTSDGDTTYKNATDVEDSSEWGLVNSVQVALLMESADEEIFDTNNATTQYRLLDATITIPENQLRHAYRVYTMTINLPNMQ